jgi:hypothetical protein
LDADVFKLNDEKWLQNYSEAMKFSKWRKVFKNMQSFDPSSSLTVLEI